MPIVIIVPTGIFLSFPRRFSTEIEKDAKNIISYSLMISSGAFLSTSSSISK
jgi:hypothetical protein